MKKNIKFIPAAFALFALASCNTDDFAGNQEIIKKDGALTVVTDVAFDGDAITRSATGYARVTQKSSGKNGTLWGTVFTAGDEVKVYAQDNWRYQVWTKADDTGAVLTSGNVQTIFELDEEKSVYTESKYGIDEVGYVVYPSDMAAFTNEERTEIGFTNFISEDGTLTLTQSEAEYPVNTNSYEVLNGNAKLFEYTCPVPMWGKAVNGAVAMKHMVGLMKISFTGVTVAEGNKIVLTTADEDKGLWNEKVEVDFNFDGEAEAPVIKATDLSGEEKNRTLTVTLPAFEGDNYILIPVPAGEYKNLKVDYQTSENSSITSATFGSEEEPYKVETSFISKVALTVSQNESMTDEEVIPETLQKALAGGEEGKNYASFGRNVVVDVENALNVGDGEYFLPRVTTIDLTGITMNNDVTFNLKNGIVAASNDGTAAKNPVLVIKGGSGNGKLTINVPESQTSAAAIVVEADVKVEINYANETALAKKVTVNENAILTGNFADVEAKAAFTVAKDAKVSIETLTAKGGDITIEGGEVKDIKATTENITVKAAVTSVTTTSGNVTVKDAKVTTITTETGTVTIDNTEADKKLEMEIGEVKLLGAATVNLDNGFVKKIDNAGEGTAAAVTITSKGKSAIAEVTNADAATITSEWDGKYYDGFGNSTDVYRKDVNYAGGNIYTAAQLAQANLQYTKQNLLANIYINKTADGDNEWSAKTLKQNFTGNGNTIYNVKLADDAEGKGLFSTVDANITISGLTIDGFKAEGTLSTVGTLIGTVAEDKTVTIKDVTVQNAAITGDKDSHDLGGLIGVVNGTVNVENAVVKAAIKGYYNLGGVIGSIGENGIAVLGKTIGEAKEGVKAAGTTIEVVVPDNEVVQDPKAGKVALAVGELNGTLELPYFSYSGWPTEADVNTKWEYRKCRFYLEGYPMVFKGCKNGSTYRYYVGYSPAAKSFKLQKTEMVSGYDPATNKINNAGTYNIFVKTTEQ